MTANDRNNRGHVRNWGRGLLEMPLTESDGTNTCFSGQTDKSWDFRTGQHDHDSTRPAQVLNPPAKVPGICRTYCREWRLCCQAPERIDPGLGERRKIRVILPARRDRLNTEELRG